MSQKWLLSCKMGGGRVHVAGIVGRDVQLNLSIISDRRLTSQAGRLVPEGRIVNFVFPLLQHIYSKIR